MHPLPCCFAEELRSQQEDGDISADHSTRSDPHVQETVSPVVTRWCWCSRLKVQQVVKSHNRKRSLVHCRSQSFCWVRGGHDCCWVLIRNQLNYCKTHKLSVVQFLSCQIIKCDRHFCHGIADWIKRYLSSDAGPFPLYTPLKCKEVGSFTSASLKCAEKRTKSNKLQCSLRLIITLHLFWFFLDLSIVINQHPPGTQILGTWLFCKNRNEKFERCFLSHL